MHDIPALPYRASSAKHRPRSNRYYFDVGIGSVCLSGPDTGGAYCLLQVGLAPGMSVPRHTHAREDEAYFVLAGELEVTVGDEVFILGPGDTDLLDLLGVLHPIIQAAIRGYGGPALVAAVSNAGALGSRCGALPTQTTRNHTDEIRRATNRPFNLNFFAHPVGALKRTQLVTCESA